MGLNLNHPIPGVGRSVGEELLEPTRIYVKPVLELIRAVRVKAMAHITGGGLTLNLPRVLPAQRRAGSIPARGPCRRSSPPSSEPAAVDDAEMRRTFNMGLGFLVVVAPERRGRRHAALEALGERVFPIGEIVPGKPGVVYV